MGPAVTISIEYGYDLMNAEEQEAIFRRWLSDHLGLMLKLVRAGAATPEDQDDLFQEVLVMSGPSSAHFVARRRKRPGFIA